MLAMVGILGGAFLGAYAFDQLVEERGGWEAGLLVCAFISILALFSWIISSPIPETQVNGNKPFRFSLMVSHFSDLFYLLKYKELRYAALGDAWFWAIGGFFYLVLVKLSGEVVSGKVGMGTLYGYWFLCLEWVRCLEVYSPLISTVEELKSAFLQSELWGWPLSSFLVITNH